MNGAFWKAIDRLTEESRIVIDRPKGSRHPRYPHMADAIICTVDLLKRDSEIKLLLGCTEEERDTILTFHNDSEYMKGMLISRD